jgi:hypothetical protein
MSAEVGAVEVHHRDVMVQAGLNLPWFDGGTTTPPETDVAPNDVGDEDGLIDLTETTEPTD